MIDVELSMRDTHVGYHARINTISDVQSGHQNVHSRQEYIIWKLQNDHMATINILVATEHSNRMQASRQYWLSV